DYQLKVALESKQLGQTFPAEVVLRYAPAPPKLTLRLGGKTFTSDMEPGERVLTVMEADLAAEAVAEAEAGAEQGLEGTLEHQKQGGDTGSGVGGEGKVSLKKDLKLAKGSNRLVAAAGPRGTLDAGDPDEVSKLVVEVLYRPAKQTVSVADPTVVPVGELRRLDGKEVVVVDTPEATVRAAVRGSSALELAEVVVGDNKPKSLLSG